ncbi:hypothetical protein B566_EDAN015607 [Ephemera danica]|nr:hypothetical protein B566_EDAN015607 [Ephemera danica]
MATLEDKILGEKKQYYCDSSSEDEKDNEEDDNNTHKEEAGASCLKSSDIKLPEPSAWEGTATNTGPKGVIKDWQRFKQLESEQSAAKAHERLAVFKKLSLTCSSHLDDEKAKAKEEAAQESGLEWEDLLKEDEFLMQYMHQRMTEMLSRASSLPKFGTVVNIENSQQFLHEVDDEHKEVTVVIHIYEKNKAGCDAMNGCLTCLSQEYEHVKFCKLHCTIAGVSYKFKMNGVPALLVYKGGQLVGNFIRLTDEFGEDFFAADVESFLIQHGILPDKSCVPQIIKSSETQDDDSDLSLE